MNKEMYITKMREKGAYDAKELQTKSQDMTGTELNSEKEVIPDFKSAVENMNMLERPIGFVCKSTAGRVVKLLQKYDSTIYTGEPEEHPAQFGFVWSDNPEHALPFIALSTSPYNKGNCCIDEGVIYCSIIDNNTWKPSDYPEGWKGCK